MKSLSACCASLAVGWFLCSAVLAQQTNSGLVSDDPTLPSEIQRHKELNGEARSEAMATTLQSHGLPVSVLQGELRHELSTKKAKPGDEVTLSLYKPGRLPNGLELPRGTLVIGHVIQVAPYSKTYKNGAMLVNFDRIRAKRWRGDRHLCSDNNIIAIGE